MDGCTQPEACRFFEINRSTFRNEAQFTSPYRFAIEQAIVSLNHEYPEWGAEMFGSLTYYENPGGSNDGSDRFVVKKGSWLYLLRKCSGDGGNPMEGTRRRHPMLVMYGLGFLFRTIHSNEAVARSLVLSMIACVRPIVSMRPDICVTRQVEHSWKKNHKFGTPKFIRWDNGPGFIGRSMGNWFKEQGIKRLYIDTGISWRNGYVESIHDKFREIAWAVKYSIISLNAVLW